jgi:hypothetical protein
VAEAGGVELERGRLVGFSSWRRTEGGSTVIISKSCMKSGFDPAKIQSIDSTKAASAQMRGTITEKRILGR